VSGSSNLRWIRHTSRFSAISDSSAGNAARLDKLAGIALQSFLRLSGQVVEPSQFEISLFRKVAWHSGLHEFQRCTFLSRSITTSAASTLDSTLFQSIVRIGTKTDLKLTTCVVWKVPFCDHGAMTLTQNCICFTNLCIKPLVLPSVTREYHLKVLEHL